MSKELISYIEKARLQGVQDENSRQSLIEAGWEPAIVEEAFRQSSYHQNQDGPGDGVKEGESDYLIAVLFSYFLGIFAVDRFYLGRIPTGIIKLLTLGGLGLWALIDAILIVFGVIKDRSGLPLRGYHEHGKIIKIIFGTLAILQLVLIPIILIALVTTTFTGVQKKARDAERSADLRSTHSLLENYYGQYGEYPTFEQMNDPDFRQNQLKAYDDSAFQDPEQSGTKLSAEPAKHTYSYQPLNAKNVICNNQSRPCVSYTLSAHMEASVPAVYEKKSLNGL